LNVETHMRDRSTQIRERTALGAQV
jgi:hypothetical protein